MTIKLSNSFNYLCSCLFCFEVFRPNVDSEVYVIFALHFTTGISRQFNINIYLFVSEML